MEKVAKISSMTDLSSSNRDSSSMAYADATIACCMWGIAELSNTKRQFGRRELRGTNLGFPIALDAHRSERRLTQIQGGSHAGVLTWRSAGDDRGRSRCL